VTCDLESVIRAAVDAARAAADVKEIMIDIEVDPNAAGARVYCDGNRMQQVIGNLLSNAVKFCPRGAKVKVACKLESFKVLILVADNGPGISPQLQPYVFERFRQADSSMTRKHGGLGLGLAIVKHLVELHGGTVRLESQEGVGSTFIVELPISMEVPTIRSEPPGPFARQEAPKIRLDGLQVLLVDDEPDTLEVVAKALQNAGADVLPLVSAHEAIEALKRKEATPHILISDLSMPELDGFDLIREVRNSGITVPQLPAVALTAFADKGHARNALLAGYQVHVTKPVDPNDLITVVASLTGRRGSSSSSK
jgi:CheY-like chemotaxis protein